MSKLCPLEGEAQSKLTLCLGKGRAGEFEVCMTLLGSCLPALGAKGDVNVVIRTTRLPLTLICECVYTPRRAT